MVSSSRVSFLEVALRFEGRVGTSLACTVFFLGRGSRVFGGATRGPVDLAVMPGATGGTFGG